MATDEQMAYLTGLLDTLGRQLDRQASKCALLDRYLDGDHPIPEQVTQAKATRAYRLLMGLSKTNWPGLIVDSVDERLEVQGFRFGDQQADKDAWAIWQRNALDAESTLAHQAALTNGRAYAIVWGDTDDQAVITLEHASTTVVQYAAGNRRKRVAALRRWNDGGRWYATLYLPDGLYKFQTPSTSDGSAKPDAWEPREVPGEDWPVDNPLGVVPVVELTVNPSLRPGVFRVASGEFEKHLGHIDRINYTVFSWIVAMTWSGFPLRAMIGDPITYDKDDDGNDIPRKPFDVVADSIVQIENPDGKLIQLPESSLTNYTESVEAHIRHLAAVTKTPAHYLLGELVNLSADAIRAAEAALVSKARRHTRFLGEDWEDVMRLAFQVEGDARATVDTAETIWRDPESRSMAERADAATKLKDILPWQALAEHIFGASPQQISQWESMRASDGLGALLAAGASTPTTVGAAVNGNGNGAVAAR